MTPRIVIVANNIEELGGAQRVSHTLAQGLAERGYDVELIGLIPKPPVHPYISRPAYRMRTLLGEPRDRSQQAAQQRIIESELGSLLADGDPGVLIAAQVWSMEHVLRVPHAGWRLIGQYHSSFQAAADDGDLARIQSAYRDVDWFTVLSDDDGRSFTAAGLNNCVTMVNPIDTWPDPPADGRSHTITVLGRMSWEKAPQIALQAWGRLAAQYPDWSLQFVGDGPLAEIVQATDIPRVRVAPTSDRPIDVLRQTGVFCLPSLIEGLPMALLEAMACGLPVVAADCSPGVRDAVGAAGVLVEPDDPDALAQALGGLLDDAQLRAELGSAARLAAERYRTAPILDRWEWLIKQTMR